MKQILYLYKKCRESESNFVIVFVRLIISKVLYGKTFFLHQHVTIKGIKNIETEGKLKIGIGYVGFNHRADRTLLNIMGRLRIKGDYAIGRGCRFDIGENGVVSIGEGGYVNSNTKIIIAHRLTIGDNCAIGWDCQFLDEDFHEISYSNKRLSGNGITVGNNVWIGCGVKIYKGTVIPDGCVIASDSVVKGVFEVENSLIAGHPAKAIKDNIQWR